MFLACPRNHGIYRYMYKYTFTNMLIHTFKGKVVANKPKIKDLSSRNLYVF